MVKRFIQGQRIKVTYEPDNDELEEFQQYLRATLKKADRSVVVDIQKTVELPRNFLKSLVLATRSLKIKGCTVTFLVASNVLKQLQNSQYASDFKFATAPASSNEPVLEIFQREEDDLQDLQDQDETLSGLVEEDAGETVEELEEIEELEIEELEEVDAPADTPPPLVIRGNQITAHSQSWRDIKSLLPEFFKQASQHGGQIVLDLRRVEEFSPAFAKWLALETLSRNRQLRLQVTKEIKEQFKKWGQGALLNMEILPHPDEVAAAPSPAVEAEPETLPEESTELQALDLTQSEAELVCQMEEGSPELEMLDTLPNVASELQKVEQEEHIRTTVEGNTIVVGTLCPDELLEELSDWIALQLDEDPERIVVDLCNVKTLTHPCLRMLARETLNSGRRLHLKVTPELNQQIQEWGKGRMLSIEVVYPEIPEPEEEPAVAETPAPEEVQAGPSTSPEGSEGDDFDFRSRPACLEVGNITNMDFRRQFAGQLEAFLKYRHEVVIDLSRFRNYDEDIARELSFQSLLARNKKIKLTFKVTPQHADFLRKTDQASILNLEYPQTAEAKVSRSKELVFFKIVGNRLVLKNMNPQKFLMELPAQFKKLLATGKSEVAIDISSLKDLTIECVKLLVLCHHEAAEAGVDLKVWIAPPQERVFLTSGEARTIPLEIHTPAELEGRSLKSTASVLKRPKIKTSFLLNQLEQDRLTAKVLKKGYKKIEGLEHAKPPERKVVKYRGPERRKEKRVAPPEMEVAFGRGIAQISQRHYPLVNLSMSGARFRTTADLPRGELLRLIIYPNNEEMDESILLQAKIIWTQQVTGRLIFDVGVVFTHIPPDSKTMLRQVVRDAYRKNLMA